MVRWSEFITSGSWNQTRSFDVADDSIKNLWSGSVPMSLAGLQNLAPSTLGSMSSGQGLDALKSKPNVVLNEEYAKKIDEILSLAVSYDPSGAASESVMEIKNRYTESGVLTKEDMKVLNGLWKILSFEKKYHSDRESVVGRIKSLLGGLK